MKKISNKSSRTRYFRIRLTEEEYEQLAQLSKNAGVTMSDYLRSVIGTSKESEWEKSPYVGFGLYRCANCHDSHSPGYPPQGFRLGKYCENCGAKMKNPQYIGIKYDFD